MVILAAFLVIGCAHDVSSIPLHLFLDAMVKQVGLLLVHELVVVDQVEWLVCDRVVLPLIVELVVVRLLIVGKTVMVLGRPRLAHLW